MITTTTLLFVLAYTPQYLETKKEECTFRGAVNDTCVALYTDVVAGDNAEHISRDVVDVLRSCFDEARMFDQGHGEHSESAQKLIVGQAAGTEGYANRYTDACIAVTGELHGKEWLKAARELAAFDKLRRALNQDFEQKCGMRGDLSQRGGPQIVLWSKATKKTVFYEDTNSDGTSVKVTCDGVITLKPKGGKAQRSSPTTIAAVRAGEKKSCVSDCQQRDSMCVEGARRGHATPTCVRYCKEKCE